MHAISGRVATEVTSAIARILFPRVQYANAKPGPQPMVNHIEVNPNAYTKPGPPISPNALIMAAMDAIPMVMGPKVFVLPKNCSGVFAHFVAHMPRTMHIIKKITAKEMVHSLGSIYCFAC